MPLPLANTAFPPADLEPWFDRAVEHDAWYSSDLAQLSRIYSTQTIKTHVFKGQTRTGGVMATVGGAFNRLFWGRHVPAGQTRTSLHVPVAADIAMMKSDMLWAEPPTFTAEYPGGATVAKATEDRLDTIANSPDMHLVLNESGELASALGGTYFRCVWNYTTQDHVRVVTTDADAAIPEFDALGTLTAVNFWTTYIKNDRYYRHFERHEVGAIIHALYVGESDNVGFPVPLAALEETAMLATLPGAIHDTFTTTITTGIDRLTVSYQPNVRASREFRKATGSLRFMGRSDYEGNEGILSALDEAWSSYLRDIRVGRARTYVPDGLLNRSGVGKGATYDDEQEVYAQIESLGTLDKGVITQQQYSIRFAEHESAILAMTKVLLRSAGLGTRDYDAEGNQLTATGELARDKREETTRDKAKRYATAATSHIMSVALELDGLIYSGKGGAPGVKVEVDFPDESQADAEKDARVIGLLNAARAISLEQKVRRANPEWTDPEVAAEVTKLKEEYPAITMPTGPNDPGSDPQAVL